MNSAAIISDDGCLDLSEQDLARLNKQFKEEYRSVGFSIQKNEENDSTSKLAWNFPRPIF